MILPFPLDSNIRSHPSTNRAKNWEETIKDVTDRAEEIIDILVSDSLLKSIKSEGVDELERVTEEIESTVDRVKRRSIKAKAEPDKELMRIITLLLEGSHDRETISIVGMGGMGKSALATNAYNHPLVLEHFDVSAWSTVRQEYSRNRIILDLLCSINIESVSDSDDDEPTKSLHRRLYGRRYLIVLLDVWSVDDWDDVRGVFPDNGNGSRIILTARSMSTAGYVHEMSFLDEDSAWEVIREKVFKRDPCPFQLESIGKSTAKSCGGHPLSIQVASRILATSDHTKAAWEDISDNIKIGFQEDEERLRAMLYLSYIHLSHHLMPCFLYLGCFPEDHDVRVSRLVKLWTAEGFLNQSVGNPLQ